MKNKRYIIIVLILIILGIVFVYKDKLFASTILNENLNINFSNLQASIINGQTYIPENPSVQKTSIKAYDVLISNPSDYATWTFDVINNSNVDAKLTNILKIKPKCISLELPANKKDEQLVCNNLEYKIFYTKNNKEVKISDILKANTKENITIKIGYIGNQELTGDIQITMFDMDFIYKPIN